MPTPKKKMPKSKRELPEVLAETARDSLACDNPRSCNCGSCDNVVTRRAFLERGTLAGAAAAILSTMPRGAVAGPFEPSDTADHFVPADKKLQPQWIEKLFQRGERVCYSGDELEKIA